MFIYSKLYEVSKKELDSTKSLLEEYLQENRVLKDKVYMSTYLIHNGSLKYSEN